MSLCLIFSGGVVVLYGFLFIICFVFFRYLFMSIRGKKGVVLYEVIIYFVMLIFRIILVIFKFLVLLEE